MPDSAPAQFNDLHQPRQYHTSESRQSNNRAPTPGLQIVTGAIDQPIAPVPNRGTMHKALQSAALYLHTDDAVAMVPSCRVAQDLAVGRARGEANMRVIDDDSVENRG
jgi:hypothetical protein